MGTHLFWFYDALVAALLLIYIYSGGKQGFLKSVILILGFAASAFIAWIVGSAISPAIYENFLQERVTGIFEERIADINIAADLQKLFSSEEEGIYFEESEMQEVLSGENEDLTGALQSFISGKYADITPEREEIDEKLRQLFDSQIVENLLGALPAYMRDPVDDYLLNSQEMIQNVFRSLTGTPKTAAEYLERTFVRPGVIALLRMVIFLVVFAVAMAVVRILSAGAAQVNKIPLAGSLNAFLGVLLGILQGAAVVMIIAVIVKALIFLTGNNLIVINTQTIEKTYLFRWFYQLIA